MNANVKGMLFTAGAVVVGILVANIIQTQLMKPKSVVTE